MKGLPKNVAKKKTVQKITKLKKKRFLNSEMIWASSVCCWRKVLEFKEGLDMESEILLSFSRQFASKAARE